MRAVVWLLAPFIVGGLVGLAVATVRADGTSPDAPAPATRLFGDVAGARGLVTRQPGLAPCGLNTAGAAWGDVDGDGDVDLFLPRQELPSQLWIQTPSGQFRERGDSAGIPDALIATGGVETAAAFGDYDGDRDLDLFVGGLGGGTLLQNTGGGSFRPSYPGLPSSQSGERRFAPPGEAVEPAPVTSASWIDFDGDGRLDLSVAHGGNCSEQPGPAPDRLYRNLGNDRFADFSSRLPSGPAGGVTLDAVWFDADARGGPELYLGNDDLNDRPNSLLSTDGRSFEEVPFSGAAISRFTMGVDAGDLTGDGLPDLVATDIGREALLVQVAPAEFSEQAAERGFGRDLLASGEPSITWGTALADFDNDGDVDAFAAGGPLGLENGRHEDALYVNDGSGSFDYHPVAASGSGRTVAPADWDRDGDVDLLVAQLGGSPLLLENRSAGTAHWLELELVGRRSARQACGATVTLRTEDGPQWRQVQCRSGDQLLHFGLGAATRAEEVRIDWPSGRRQRIGSLPADRLRVIREPTAVAEAGDS